MAPDAIHPQVLSVHWDSSWAMLHLSTVKMPAHKGYSPVTSERPSEDPPTMVLSTEPMLPTPPTFPMFWNLQQYLWGGFQRVLRRLWAAKELFSSTRVLLFLCSGYRARSAMKGGAEKSIVGRGGAEEKLEKTRVDQASASMLKTQVEKEKEVLMRRTMEVEEEEEEEERETEAEDMQEFTDEEEEEEDEEEEDEEPDSDWMEWGSEEEDDVEGEDALHHQTVPTTVSYVGISFSLNSKQANEDEEDDEGDEEEDSDWSEEGEDDDSEASAESVELWESFLQSDDPYNPLSFSSCTTSRTSNTTHSSPANGEIRADDWEEREGEEKNGDGQHSTHIVQQKKVRFSDEVTVRPLVDWAQASREARDGSCWLEMARDRDRFRRRVEDAGKVISVCLSPEHRCLVWEKLQKQAALNNM